MVIEGRALKFGITEKPTTDCISPCNKAVLVSKVSEKSQRKRWNLPFSTTPLSFDANVSLGGKPSRIFAYVLYRQKLQSLAYIFPPIMWVYLRSNFCGRLLKTHLFSNKVRIGRSWSCKVVAFGTNRKGVCDFLLVINSNFTTLVLSCTVSEIRLKIANFSYPSFNALARDEPFRSSGWIFLSLGLSVGEDFVILACVVFTQCQRLTDRQTGRRTNNRS